LFGGTATQAHGDAAGYTGTDTAGDLQRRVILIRSAVAIFVNAVASRIRRGTLTRHAGTLDSPATANRRPLGEASTDAALDQVTLERLVGASVAVIVGTITGRVIARRLTRVATQPSSAAATYSTAQALAHPDPARGRFFDIAFVDPTVAIRVLTIAIGIFV